ncbi:MULTISPECIES: ATP/GTP-binding protein [Polynucleobacter]|jgi:AAA15 family ATPase/GTPase|uniref:AAA family ATPase n=1 Tax=Polynucleobacter TaxID=44013 RepID=UPI0008FBA41C|nr:MULTISPECIES: ATP-binding protein [Polynucleobacter]APC06148.1 hypothetical protein AOC10_06235 [Polynucleobacter asymbioticus]MBT8582702.1 ATP-binding protein [Polynucleobacter paneuropaeus]MBT8611897.1 ATP-binding protein [Polynucleobacter paneuropaeus]MBU3624428.1 ATP-binding protein [Polynucleobacter sp. AP-Latsch-80-C2]
MLIEFSVANFKSILERQTLSMVASTDSEHAEKNVIELPDEATKYLKSAVVYGPNAAGKSNLLKATLVLQQLILHSASSQEGIPMGGITPFLLDGNIPNEPSEFNIVFIANDGVKYEYHLSATPKSVEKEWMVSYPNGRPQRWFERELNKESGKYEWWFGSKFKGDKAEKKVWQEFTRNNSLFFSTAVQLNNEQLKTPFGWIANQLIVITSGIDLNPWLSINLIKNNEGYKILDYLKAADVGIDGIDIKEEELPPQAQFIGNNPFALGAFHFNLGGPEDGIGQKPTMIKVTTTHKNAKTNEVVHLSIEDESEGTRKLFNLTGGWIRSLDIGATLLVDELERSLHPKITRFLVELFHSKKNKSNAQLVFTTHDTNLLDTALLRRDQIWFVEKSNQKATHLYSLLDYNPRKEEALERGYLKGRYGAVPVVGEIN